MEVFTTKNIYKTEDYSLFKELHSNRPIKPSHVIKLKKLIQEENRLPQNPIFVNKNMQVLDGQHRLIAAKELSLPIYYEIIEGDIHDAKLFNIGREDWSMSDFLFSYCKENNAEYIYIRDFMAKYETSLNMTIRLLGGVSKAGDIILLFKTGKFQGKDKYNAEIMAQRLLELRPYTEKNVITDREFLTALQRVYKKVGHDELLRKLELSRYKLLHYERTIDYIRALSDIYNRNRINKIIFE